MSVNYIAKTIFGYQDIELDEDKIPEEIKENYRFLSDCYDEYSPSIYGTCINACNEGNVGYLNTEAFINSNTIKMVEDIKPYLINPKAIPHYYLMNQIY